MKLYNVIIVNEVADVVDIKHFTTKADAEEGLNNQHETYRDMLENEGLGDDNFNPAIAFTLYYGSEYFYRGQIVESEL